MTDLDRLIQQWRIRKAARHFCPQMRLLDIGAHKGELFKYLGSKLAYGYGIESSIYSEIRGSNYVVVPGIFPNRLPEEDNWDAISMLAVLEHIPRADLNIIANYCLKLLRPGGRVIVTIPRGMADNILWAMKYFRLIDGMALDEHSHVEPEQIARIFVGQGFNIKKMDNFQLGLNVLYVFEKTI